MKTGLNLFLFAAVIGLSAPSAFAVKVMSSSGVTDCKAKSQQGLFARTNPTVRQNNQAVKTPVRVGEKRSGRR